MLARFRYDTIRYVFTEHSTSTPCVYIYFKFFGMCLTLGGSLAHSYLLSIFIFCFDSYVGVSVHKEFLRKIQVLILICVRFDWTLKEEWKKKNVAADFAQIFTYPSFIVSAVEFQWPFQSCHIWRINCLKNQFRKKTEAKMKWKIFGEKKFRHVCQSHFDGRQYFTIKIHWKYVQNGFSIKNPANAIANAIVDQVNQEIHQITAKNWSDEIELYTQVHMPCSVCTDFNQSIKNT